MPHMDEGRLQAWLDGPRSGLPVAEREEIAAHVASCDVCAVRLSQLRSSDVASRDLLGSMGAAERGMPDFSEIVDRSRSLEAPRRTTGAPLRRRFPVQWAASIVLALGVGWMANEVARTDGRAGAPAERLIPTPAFDAGVPAPGTADVAGEDALTPSPALEASAEPTESTAPDRDAAAAGPEATVQAARARGPEGSDPQAAELRALAPPPASAQGAPRPVSAEQARNALDAAPASDATWVNGRVTDATGLPIEDAVVTIPGTPSSALSGPDGRFRMQISADSLGPGAQLQALYVGYAPASRDVPPGVGELSVGDLRMEQRAIELEGVVVTGTAIAAQRRTLAAPNRLAVGSSDAWRRVGVGDAEALLGARPLRLPGLNWTTIEADADGDPHVVRVSHETESGAVVVLLQSRSAIDIELDPGTPHARRTTAEGLHLLAIGPIDPVTLADLLDRAEEIVDPQPDPGQRR
jgi:hypothetical protein